ncbi:MULTISPECIES: DNA repair protein RecN [unclassified Desulfobacter]|jgi:DNA repair protein RecN (Recombination protein N)|uniref:DNA repair protein RecN n=1 Tax=unclassified Desulfobacter TaxID=2634406 RepID=UPI000E8F59A8|nr:MULTISPECIES: DNA repair protein RecN [unclassified Desulfobacter]MBP8830399.1 DNA repair protein RecN [Desulfobacter sp.]HBT89806.1 DNA repair protein RecN [Desulfobacter sp.]
MLHALVIKNFAIIEDLRIEFGPGLSVLTGETGAGKSIIIQAVNLLLGSRASADLVRTGKDNAELEAVFDIAPDSHAARLMADQDMDIEEGLIIRRVVSAEGKSKIYINARQTTLDFLKQVTENLAGVSSQHAHQGLLKEDQHLDILDEFAQTLDLRKDVAALYRQILPLKKEIAGLKAGKEKAEKELELLQFQVNEIETANIQPGEDEELVQKRDQLQNAGQIFEAVNGAVHDLYDREGSVLDQISGLSARFGRFCGTHEKLGALARRLDEISYELQDLVSEFRSFAAGIDLDPQSLDQVDQRLDQIARLKRKYGGSLDTIFEQYRNMAQTVADIQGIDGRIEQLEQEQKGLVVQIRQKAKALSMRRQKEGLALARQAKAELGVLEMGRASFEVDFSTDPCDDPSELVTEDKEKIFITGMDRVRFLLSPNPGETPKPLAKIASGGELSRIVLALKAVLCRGQSFETLIFDEVDAGIGGATSDKVGLKLKELGRVQQVICITHLAQIARYGNHQFRITKEVSDGRTATRITPLNCQEERIKELARMIGGSRITDATLVHARELLDTAQES